MTGMGFAEHLLPGIVGTRFFSPDAGIDPLSPSFTPSSPTDLFYDSFEIGEERRARSTEGESL
jgi:hypothetical protein